MIQLNARDEREMTKVKPIRSQTSSFTGRFQTNERPMSPCTNFVIHRKYCTNRGLSRPYWRVSESINSWLTSTSMRRSWAICVLT